MTELRVLLVDDEMLSIELMRSIVDGLPGFAVAATCSNGEEAVARLQQEAFDILLTDIEMPGLTGLEVVEKTQADLMPVVIFATAFDQYACQAFDLHAVDYVLKPFDPDRVRMALDRAKERLSVGELRAGKDAPLGAIADLRQVDRASTEGAPSLTEYERLPIKDGGHTYLLPHEDIDWIDAAGDYMCVHATGKVHILRSTMKDLEAKLSQDFVRVHRSTIVNVRKVRAVDTLPKGECLLHLDDDVKVRVSRNYRSAIQPLLK
jgi:two-component system LytT family response regulator